MQDHKSSVKNLGAGTAATQNGRPLAEINISYYISINIYISRDIGKHWDGLGTGMADTTRLLAISACFSEDA